MNAVVLHNATIAAGPAINVTGAGGATTLAITSGALLFTLDPTAAAGAYGTTLGGYDAGITVGATNEYVIHVVNPSAATASVLTATISSPLTSAADITKSGRGTLILSAPALTIAGGGANKTTINEGTLEIADLDNIGGGTGALVFAGGTLRLGSTLTDDISTRAISYLGNGTIDTNGVSLLLAGDIGTGAGSLTKTGAGNLTLGLASARTGNTTVSGGTLTVAANDAIGLGGALNVAAGGTLDILANNISVGLVTTSGASPQIAGTGTITSSAGFFLNHTGNTSIGAVLAGSVGVLKAQTNEVTLTGANTYTGPTEVQNGSLSFSDIGNVGAISSNLGAPTTAENGMIRMGLSTNSTALTYTGAGSSTDRYVALQGTSGGATLNGSGTGAIVYSGGVGTILEGAKTLTLGGTSAPAVVNEVSGPIIDGIGTLGVAKADANTWKLTGLNTYTGATAVNGGTLEVASSTGGSTAAGTSVALGAVLTGTGVISGATATHTVSGTVSPGANAGASLGVLNFEANSNLTFNPGSSAMFSIGDPSLTYDRIKSTGTGTLTLDAGLTITVAGFDGGYTPVDTNTWTLLDWTTIAGNGFNVGLNGRQSGLGGGTLDLPDVSSFGLQWEVGNFLTNGSISVVVIPEPGRMLLMFFGLAALFLRRRRQA